jgi:hypothetical protein
VEHGAGQVEDRAQAGNGVPVEALTDTSENLVRSESGVFFL